jgi:mRNA interferase RelE/StbE
MIDIRFASRAKKQIEKLDKPVRNAIRTYLETIQNAITLEDLHRLGGTELTGNLKGLWRFKNPTFKDYRVIGVVEDTVLVIIVLAVEKRSEIYKNKEDLAKRARKK